MYDMPRVGAWGYFDEGSADARYESKKTIAQLRTKEYLSDTFEKAGGCLDYQAPDDVPDFVKQYSAYYKTKRGYHPRSVNSNAGWVLQSTTGWMNNAILTHPEDLRNAVLIVHGEKAHSRYMGEDTFKKLQGDNKELLIVENATHTDLYDGGEHHYIPFDKINAFFNKYLVDEKK